MESVLLLVYLVGHGASVADKKHITKQKWCTLPPDITLGAGQRGATSNVKSLLDEFYKNHETIHV